MSADASALRGYRRTATGGIAAIGAMLITFFATAGTGAAAPAQSSALPPGQGFALAQNYRIDPRAGNLSIGINFGISLAGHQNSVAQASSQALDLGVIGTSLAAEGCDGSAPTLPPDKQPQPLQVDSRDPTAAQGKQADETAVPLPIHKFALANPNPYGEAITTTAAQGIPGVLEIGPGTSRSYSGLLDGGATREAKATSDISSINIATVVQLTNIHWEATWRSAPSGGPTEGKFTIGGATIGGTPVPTQDPNQVIAQANQLLSTLQLGIIIDPPKIRQSPDGKTQFVDPMGISIVPSTQRDLVASTLLGGIQPLRQSLFDALLQAKCSNATYITIFDIVLGSITGAGSFNLTLGGVQASSGEIAANPFQLGTFVLGSANNAAGGVAGGTAGTPGSHTDGTPGAAPGGGAGAPGATKNASPIGALKSPGARGGALAGVGLGCLGFLAALAEGDRRKMRRAQREIPQFTV